MQDQVKIPSGIEVSVNTFRPLMILPWYCSIWRQFPLRAAVATIRFKNRAAAEQGHREVVELLRTLEVGPKMHELFDAIEEYAKTHGNLVGSFRIDPGHQAEGKVSVEISEKRIH